MYSLHQKIILLIAMLFVFYSMESIAAPIYTNNQIGIVVCMFYSGTDNVKGKVEINDTLVVYRENT